MVSTAMKNPFHSYTPAYLTMKLHPRSQYHHQAMQWLDLRHSQDAISGTELRSNLYRREFEYAHRIIVENGPPVLFWNGAFIGINVWLDIS